MGPVLFVLAAIGVTIYAVIDCWRSDDAETRGLPKPLWLLVILGVPLAGGVLWILFGRQAAPGSGGSRRIRVVAPDDDPEFLRSLQPPRRRGPDDDNPTTPS